MESDRVVKCLFCGNNAELKDSKLLGYQEPESYEIYHCPNCNTSFSLPRVETSNIYENIYKDGKTVPGYDRYWRYMNMVKNSKRPFLCLSKEEDTYWAVKESLEIIVKDKGSTKILEIGSGLGYLIYSMITDHYDAVGIDISETAVQQAIKTFGNHYISADLFEFVKQHAVSFDVVILTEVIEHVNRPVDFIEAIKQLLRPGGHAIITTPNKSLYPSDIIWATELPPVHCWWFSEDSMKFIGKELNLKVDFINFKKYYKINPLTLDLRKIRNGQKFCPTLDCKGAVNERITKRKSDLFINLRSRIYRIVFLKKTYNFLMKIAIKDSLSCNERGEILCTIMKKNG